MKHLLNIILIAVIAALVWKLDTLVKTPIEIRVVVITDENVTVECSPEGILIDNLPETNVIDNMGFNATDELLYITIPSEPPPIDDILVYEEIR